jgi:hypothetical protein
MVRAKMPVATMGARKGGQGTGQQRGGEQSGNEFLHDDYLREEKNACATQVLTGRL